LKHRTTERFWRCYHGLPSDIQGSADNQFEMLKENPSRPSLHFKKVGHFWSARVSQVHRALAVEDGDDFIWVWVGTHDEYDRILKNRCWTLRKPCKTPFALFENRCELSEHFVHNGRRNAFQLTRIARS
jgi:hypothetical protein